MQKMGTAVKFIGTPGTRTQALMEQAKALLPVTPSKINGVKWVTLGKTGPKSSSKVQLGRQLYSHEGLFLTTTKMHPVNY